jgi:tellurite methyltransferase
MEKKIFSLKVLNISIINIPHDYLPAYHIPASELKSRMHELCDPSNKQILYVISLQTPEELEIIKFLKSKGYLVEVIRNVDEIVLSEEDKEKYMKIWGGFKKGQTQYQLWDPSPLIENRIGNIEKDLCDKRCVCLDVGCGSGRDAVYLNRRGWKIYALDSNNSVLEKLRQFIGEEKNNSILTSLIKIRGDGDARCLLSNKCGSLEDIIPEIKNQIQLITIIRCLPPRNSFKMISDILLPGGHILISTFIEENHPTYKIWATQESVKNLQIFDHPKSRNSILERKELSGFFISFGFEILMDEVSYLKDGRPISYFHARKI